MDITISVDGDQFADSLTELIQKLSDEQIQQVLENVLKNFLGVDSEYRLLASVLQAQQERDRSNWYSASGLSYERQQTLDKFVSTRQKLINTMSDRVASHVETAVDRLVSKDDVLQRIWYVVRDHVVESFPGMVQAALTRWFIEHMAGITGQLQHTHDKLDSELYKLKDKLKTVLPSELFRED